MNTHENIPHHPHMEERLWDYIDGLASVEERGFIEDMIAQHLEWKQKYQELLDVHSLTMNHLELDEPSLRFTKNVMEAIAKEHIAPAANSYLNKKVIWGISLFFFTMILGFLIYGFAQIDWTTGTGQNVINFDYSKLEWNKFFNNTYATVFLLINGVLGLVLLDMVLERRKRVVSGK